MISSSRTDGDTDGQTHTKVTTEGTLSGFQEFFLQPIIKDRPKMPFFLIRFLGQKMWSVARLQTDTQTYTSGNNGHPFRVSGIFPSNYHQVVAQYNKHISYRS